MRIAFICGFAWEPKGTVRSRAHPLAAELVRRGHEVSLFIAPYDNPAQSGRELTLNGVRIVNLKVSGSGVMDHGRLVISMCRAVDRYSPDLIHVFKPKGIAGAACLYNLLRGRRGLVLDCDDWEGWGGWNEVVEYPWIVKQFIDWQEKWLVRRAPIITAASQVLANRARQLRNRNGVFYLPNCLTRDRATEDEEILQTSNPAERRSLGLPEGPIIFYGGHFIAADDLEFFCRATAPVARAYGAALALVGDGPGRNEVVEFFNRNQIEVLSFGALSFDKYRRVLNAADIACFPFPDSPVYQAKCSARILDYMSLGKAILTSSIGQNLEYLVHGESALLVSPGDEPGYQQSLRSLLDDSDLRRVLGARARQSARSRFSWEGRALTQCLEAYAAAVPTECVAAKSNSGARVES